MHLLSFNLDGQPCLTSSTELETPQYAILSHTWEAPKHEVTFEEISEGSGRQKNGYRKVEFCRKQAEIDGLKYFWIDTCCIDKSSSAELAEAINSMFKWYRNAEKCYVYLADVSTESGTDRDLWEPAFLKSRWFFRGWTLQELLAPRIVEFFSRQGQKLGDKNTLLSLLHAVTDIPLLVLRGIDFREYPNGEKIRWAAKRHTTRPEDKAYSPLGIFNVFIPPIYGEGEWHALRRLREAVDEAAENAKRDPHAALRGEDGSIQRTRCLRMTFPKDSTADCILHMTISGKVLPDIMHHLTGVRVTVVEGKRRVSLPNGASIIPLSVMRINGLNDVDLHMVLPRDDEITTALKKSILYKRQMAGEYVVDSCLSFLIPADEDSDVVVDFTLDRKLGEELALKFNCLHVKKLPGKEYLPP